MLSMLIVMRIVHIAERDYMLFCVIMDKLCTIDLLCFPCLVFAMPLYVSVFMCLVVTCWERADLLALVCGVLL